MIIFVKRHKYASVRLTSLFSKKVTQIHRDGCGLFSCQPAASSKVRRQRFSFISGEQWSWTRRDLVSSSFKSLC